MRYIGAKTDLLPEIADFIKQQGILNDSNLTFCNAFSGTAAGVTGEAPGFVEVVGERNSMSCALVIIMALAD